MFKNNCFQTALWIIQEENGATVSRGETITDCLQNFKSTMDNRFGTNGYEITDYFFLPRQKQAEINIYAKEWYGEYIFELLYLEPFLDNEQQDIVKNLKQCFKIKKNNKNKK